MYVNEVNTCLMSFKGNKGMHHETRVHLIFIFIIVIKLEFVV